jgi:hypothetical protein
VHESETDKPPAKTLVSCTAALTADCDCNCKDQLKKQQAAVDEYRNKVYLSHFLEGLGLS